MIKEVREAETALPGSFPDPGPRHTPRRRDPFSIPVRACPSPGPLIHSLSFIHLPLQQPRGSLCAQSPGYLWTLIFSNLMPNSRISKIWMAWLLFKKQTKLKGNQDHLLSLWNSYITTDIYYIFSFTRKPTSLYCHCISVTSVKEGRHEPPVWSVHTQNIHRGSHSTVRLPELKQKVDGMLELAYEFTYSHHSGVLYLPVIKD